MRFTQIECSDATAEKLWSKHRVDLSEVDEVLGSEPHVRRGRDGLYYVLGQTRGGRYLFIVLRKIGDEQARLVTAREMDDAERGLYRRR